MLVVKHYVEALSLELTHLYQALPRLLFLWFHFTSTSTLTLLGSCLSCTSPKFTQHWSQPSVNVALKELAERQKELNVLLAKEITRIPGLAFYTALPQLLISCIFTNDQSESYLVVRNILKRVLANFPAMWSYVSRSNSNISDCQSRYPHYFVLFSILPEPRLGTPVERCHSARSWQWDIQGSGMKPAQAK